MANNPSRNRPGRIAGRGWIVPGAVALLVLVAVAVALSIPAIRDGLFRGGQPTPTTVAVEPTATAAARPVATGEAPPVTLTPPTPTPSPIPPREFEDLLAQAQALTFRSEFEAASILYQFLAEAAPDDPRPEIGWAWALILDQESYEALAHAQRAVELDDGAEAAVVLARANIEVGEGDEALIQAQSAVERDPENATAHAVLAEVYARDGQVDAAVEEADRALALDIGNAEAHRIRGWLYQQVDADLARAAGELQQAAGIQPDLWLRRYELGRLLLDGQNYDTALTVLQDALALRPKATVYAALGQAAYWLEQYDGGRTWLEQAVAAGAEDVDTYAFLAACLARLEDCEQARAYAADALRLDAAHPQALEADEACRPGRPAASPSATTGATPGATQAPTARPSPPVGAGPAPAQVSGWIAFPVWNPERGKYDSYVARARDGGERRLVAEEMHQPALSPDGQWLAVNGEQADHMYLFLARVDGTALHEITSFLEDGQPAWSPDGQRLAFASTRHGDKEFRIYVVDAVPFAGGRVEGRTLNYGPDDVRGRMPAWTSDGRIVYQGCSLDSSRGECSGLGLFVMSAEPGPQTPEQITSNAGDTAPAVFGSRVVFTSNRDGNWELYSVNLDGSDLRRLIDDAAADGLPAWSPDGTAIAFVSDRGGAWAVWVINADGSNRRKLFDLGAGGLAFDWLQERITWVR